MANVGKFAPEVLASRPPTVSAAEGEIAIFRNVIANWGDKWLRFDTMEMAKQVVPLNEHYKIYVDVNDMQKKLGIRGLRALNEVFRAKSGKELWGILQMQAYDPKVKYEDIIKAEAKDRHNTRGTTKVKRYKRKIAYRFVFDPDNEGCMSVYGRLPPQGCALVDIMQKATLTREQPIWTEEELQGLFERCKDDLHTKQNSWRIFQYYRGKLIGSGFLRFHREKT